jgi:hypothetical protein
MAADWLVSQAAGWIAGTVLDHLSTRAQSRLMGSETSLAMRRAYDAAIRSFIAELPDDISDYADALELFFHDQRVSTELSVLLEPDSLARPDVDILRAVLVASGFDFSTAQGFSIEAAVRQMSDAFVAAAVQDETLRSILQYRLSVETRLIVETIHQQTSTFSLDEVRAVLELEGYRLAAFEIDDHGDALVQFHRPGRRTIVVVGSVQFRASLLALILNRIDRDPDSD